MVMAFLGLSFNWVEKRGALQVTQIATSLDFIPFLNHWEINTFKIQCIHV